VGGLLSPGAPEATNVKCYASAYGGCSAKITREHYFTRSVLAQLDGLEVRGLPGRPLDTPTTVGIQALTAKVLCEVHNPALSALDSVGARFFEVFRAAGKGLPTQPTFDLLNGHDVERWLLKVMLGFGASGAAPDEGRRVRLHETPDVSLLHSLYQGDPMGPGRGLYFVEPADGRFSPGRLGFNLLFHRLNANAAHIVGVQADLNGFSFALLLRPPANGGRPQFNDVWFRPQQVWIRRQDETVGRVVEFTWPEGNQGGVVELIEGA